MKIMIGINTLAGFFFLGSMLVTTYQQYVTYIESVELFDNLPDTQFPKQVWDKNDLGGKNE